MLVFLVLAVSLALPLSPQFRSFLTSTSTSLPFSGRELKMTHQLVVVMVKASCTFSRSGRRHICIFLLFL